MKIREVPSLGVTAKVLVPESIDEYNSLAPNRENACLADAIDKELYHGTLGDFREEFCDLLEAETQIERKKVLHPEGKKNDDGTPVMVVDETEGKYSSRVYAEKGVEGTAFQHLADKVQKTLDPSARERKERVAKIPKRYIDVAEQAISNGVADRVAARLTELLGRAVSTEKETLASAIREDQLRKERELLAGYSKA